MNLSNCLSAITPSWITRMWAPSPAAPSQSRTETDVFERTHASRAPERARLNAALEPRASHTPSLERLLQAEATQRGTSVRGVELRFYDPRGIIAAYAMDPRFADVACSDLYQYLLHTENFGPSCGETSAALKAVLFDGTTRQSSGEDALYTALRTHDDTFMRVQIGCHSFIIEKRNAACRVYQSYDGWYSLAQSLPDDRAIPTESFIASLRTVIRRDQASTHAAIAAADQAQEQLFHGEVDATRNARGDDRYCIHVEIPERKTTQAALPGRFDALLDRYADTWSAFEAERELSVQAFAKTQWPAFFVG